MARLINPDQTSLRVPGLVCGSLCSCRLGVDRGCCLREVSCFGLCRVLAGCAVLVRFCASHGLAGETDLVEMREG